MNAAEKIADPPNSLLAAALLAAHPTFSPEKLAIFVEKWQAKSFSKNQFLLREGAASNHFYFLETGLARIFYQKDDREITEWLAFEGQFFLSISSFYERLPSRLAIHFLEPSVVRMIHHDDIMSLSKQFHDVETWHRKGLTSSLLLAQKRMESIQFESARERYRRLIEQNPGIIQRVSMGHIASFLGITPETLSRIRAMR